MKYINKGSVDFVGSTSSLESLSDAISIWFSNDSHPSASPSITILYFRVSLPFFIASSTFLALDADAIVITASPFLILYSMSSGISMLGAGKATAPTLFNPSITAYHSTILGTITRTLSPFFIPKDRRTFANLLDILEISQNEYFFINFPVVLAQTKANFVLSCAHLSTTSKAKL